MKKKVRSALTVFIEVLEEVGLTREAAGELVGVHEAD